MLKGPSRTNWAFEGFKVMTERRLLIAGGSPVPLTSKAWVVISSTDQTRRFAVDRTGDATIGMMTNWAPDESGLDYVVTRNGVSNIWRQPLTGGPPVQITRFSAGRIFSFAWSPDGQWLSLGSGINRSDVVLMFSEP